MGKFCKNCGSPMKENEKFCANCGTKNDTVQAEASSSVKSPRLAMTGVSIRGGIPVRTGSVGMSGAARYGGTAGSNEMIYKMALTVIGILMIISTLMPYVWKGGGTVSLLFMDDDIKSGVLYIVIAVVCIGGALMGKSILTVITGVASSALCFYEVNRVNEICQTSELKEVYEVISALSGRDVKRAGFYMIIITSVSMLIVSILYFQRTIKRG